MESDALKIEFEYPGDMRLAMVACLLAGCGHGNPSADVVVDAGADAGADAPVDVDPASLVTIHVYTAAGVDDTTAIAMFADDTGAYVATTVVDSHGDATASLPHGGTVTALQIVTDDTLHEFDTFTSFHGVKPGDHLVAGRPLSNDQPSGATDTMAASYTSHSNNTPGGVMSCGSVDFGLNTPAATLTFYASCEAATFDLLAIQDVGTQRMFLWQPGLAHTAGGTVALPDAWQSVGTLALEVDNAPGNRAHTGAEYEALVDGIPMELDFQSIQLAPAGTNLFTLHPAVGAGTKTRITVGANDDGGYLAESLTAIVEPDTTALTLDMAAHPLPLPGTFGKTSPTDITWTETASGTGDLRVVWWGGAQWIELGNNIPHQAAWTFIEDPRDGSTSTTIPRLPDAYAKQDVTRVDPKQVTMSQFAGAIGYFDYDMVDGFDAARPIGPQLQYPSLAFPTTNHISHAITIPAIFIPVM
jgi:hypothetical protein